MKYVVHCKKEPYDVYIGRPGIWGNPYSHIDVPNTIRVRTREEAIEMYVNYLIMRPELLLKVKSLRGKTLGCYCEPLLCHGHILAALANEGYDPSNYFGSIFQIT